MGKRTIRIPRSKIAAELPSLSGRSVQVVMLDGKTHAGCVLSTKSDEILVEDANAAWTGKSRHQQRLLLQNIHYIVYNLISTW